MERKQRKKSFIHHFPRYGCISTGLIYAAVGVIALLSFFKVRDGGADESSMLAIINDYTAGKMFIWIILTGTLSYIIWRFYEAITDPYGYGTGISGIMKRIGICLSTIADIMIAYAAVCVLLGTNHFMLNGQPREEQKKVASLLLETWGSAFIILIGLLIIVIAASQFLYGVTKGYKERIDMNRFNEVIKTITHILAWSGYFARGIIIGIIGFFLMKSGMTEDAKLVVNTDKAFDFIGDHVGHFYFILVALGTICYGIFMFIMGTAYHTNRLK